MTFLRKTSQVLAMLLILLLGAVLVVPAGLHLEFCLGEGGHFDISLDFCPDVPRSQRQPQDAALSDQTHHGECIDLAVFCNSSEEIARSDVKIGAHKTKIKKDPSLDAGFFADSFSNLHPHSGNLAPFRLARQTFPPPHLASLRTVVLLI